jgi:hypothetical protein
VRYEPPRRAVLAKLRDRLEAAIEQAVTLLDRIDGDPDFEASLAVEELLDQRLWATRAGIGDDLEWGCEDEGHDSDREPDTDSEDDGRTVGDVNRAKRAFRARTSSVASDCKWRRAAY